MSAETLRRAAGLMRERAEAVDLSVIHDFGLEMDWAEQIAQIVRTPDSTHLTTFGHPAVALAVADWLDQVAGIREEAADGPLAMAMRALSEPADIVARAYLGEDA